MKKITLCLGCMLLPFTLFASENWKAFLRYDKQKTKADLTAHLQKYAQTDSHALLQTTQVPSTKAQTSLAKSLAKELKHMGATHVQISKNSIVTADIPASTATPLPTLALVAHYDTAPQTLAQEPSLKAKYTSGNILLDKTEKKSLTEENSPQLHRAHGHDLLLSNGTASFGAATKAGLAILMTAADYLLANPSVPHGAIKLILLPDAVSHQGAAALDVKNIGADYAYVLDGQDLGEITIGNFAGRSFTVVFEGQRDIPLGQAVSSNFADNLLMASDFHTLLPRHYRPETTSGQKGYITLDSIETQGNRTTIHGHLRAFTEPDLQMLSGYVSQAFNTVKAMYPKRTGAELTFQNEFANVQKQIPPALLSTLEKALRSEDIHPKRIYVRNYADFAVLTQAGLPTVSVFTGVFHGDEPFEYADVDIMEASLRGLLSMLTSDLQALSTTK